MKNRSLKKSFADMLVEIEERMSDICFDDELRRYSLPCSAANDLKTAPYYKGLAAAVDIFGCRRVLEFGTLFGASAMALAKFAEEVLTCDLDLQPAERTGLFSHNIRGLALESAPCCLSVPVSDVDLCFVDIDHSSIMERLLHERFQQSFRGIVFYDDIDLNGEMREFWASIELDKLALPWHHSGFGAVWYADPEFC